MRLTCDVLRVLEQRIPFCDDHGRELGALWAMPLVWACREQTLELTVIGAEPLALPAPEPSEPAVGAIARLLKALAGTGALVLLRNPAAAFGVERIAFSDGVRLFAISTEADEACWDAALSLGQPVYGVRGLIACEVWRPHPATVLSALAYGQFTCEEGLRLSGLAEDHVGVRYVAAVDAVGTVIIRHGFEAARLVGSRGDYRDRGNEAYVRVVVRAAGGACWTQPRFISPHGGSQHAGNAHAP